MVGIWYFSLQGDMEKATAFYQSTLALQSSFEPARDRLRAIQCATLDENTTSKNWSNYDFF